MAKVVRKASSVSSYDAISHLRNDRDATSAMLFVLPSIDTVRSGDDLVTLCRMASAMRSRAATLDFVEDSFFDQATVGVLSQ